MYDPWKMQTSEGFIALGVCMSASPPAFQLRRSSEKRIRVSHGFLKLFFVTDVHGSTTCFKKFIRSVRRSSPPDVLILGGDITGKLVIPVVTDESDTATIKLQGRDQHLAKGDIPAFEAEAERVGWYVYRCDEDTFRKYSFDVNKRKEVAKNLQSERVSAWLRFAESELSTSKTRLIINTGNDDDFYIDRLIQASSRVEFPDNRVIGLPQGLKLLSIGHSNPTPWKCPRELSDKALKKRIAKLANQAGEFGNCIFNFHCPPENTQLDLAPKLDASLRPQIGPHGQEFENVGSSAVREAILTFQPALSLHGHVHEQHIVENLGSTICVNPGSSYWTGSLQGAIATFKDGKIAGVKLTSERISSGTEGMQRVFGMGLTSLIPFIGHPSTAMLHQLEIEELRDRQDAMQREFDALKPGRRQSS
jgi:Icc-related predicted phosphoesterase